MNEETLLKLQHFFVADMKLKKELYLDAPNNWVGEDSLIEYTDKLYESLLYIFGELKCISNDIFGSKSMTYKKVCNLEKTIKKEFNRCGFDNIKLKEFYKKYLSSMSIEFVNSVKDSCVGYYINRSEEIVESANSVNEILHFIHSYVVNNENILEKIPLINEKDNNYGYELSLRGSNSEYFEGLFNMFPTDLDCGTTDMVIINERKLIMMVRDRGHALTLEITLGNDKARVEYFIPKLCNIDMINALEGINKVNSNSVGATGVFETSLDQLPIKLFEFISKVPMDIDMPQYQNLRAR